MKVFYQELEVNHKNLRGLLSMPDDENYKNIVTMFHGYTGHKNEHGFLFKQLTKTFVELGYATIRFDFSGSGDSDGEYYEMTYFTELEEARAIINYAYKMANKPIIALGFSMGGAITADVSGQMVDKVEQVVLLSPAGNMDQIVTNRYQSVITNDGLIDIGGFCIGTKLIETLKGYDLYQNVKNFDKKVLIIHGSDDQSVPIEFGRRYHSIYPNSTMYTIEGAPHGYSNIKFREQIKEIIIKHLGE